MIVVVLEGVTHYNSYINHTLPFKWIIHPNWYAAACLSSWRELPPVPEVALGSR
jgi:hypothetical protein